MTKKNSWVVVWAFVFAVVGAWWVSSVHRQQQELVDAGADAGVDASAEAGTDAGSAPEREHWYFSAAITDILDEDPERVHNIEIAAAALNQLYMPKGSSFSFNDVVGPRDQESGFLPAASQFYGGKQETFGGGICQVSTTLYMALMQAGIHPLRRFGHSQPVPYAELGMDAAVSWGEKDLLFVAPEELILQAYIGWRGPGYDKHSLVVRIGTRAPQTLWSSKWSAARDIAPQELSFTAHPSRKKEVLVRRGKPGVEGYRRWTKDGCTREVGEDVGKCSVVVRTRYEPVDTVYAVPVKADGGVE